MGIEFDLEVRPGYLSLVCAGELTQESFAEVYEKALAAAQAHGVKAVLLDGRAVTARPQSILERFNMGHGAAELQRKYSLRCFVAIVAHPPVADPQKFGETVATNRGILGGVYFDIDEALAAIAERLDTKRS